MVGALASDASVRKDVEVRVHFWAPVRHRFHIQNRLRATQMVLAFSVGLFAAMAVAGFNSSWMAGLAVTFAAIAFYFWRFSVLLAVEHDPAYDCTFMLFCFLKGQ